MGDTAIQWGRHQWPSTEGMLANRVVRCEKCNVPVAIGELPGRRKAVCPGTGKWEEAIGELLRRQTGTIPLCLGGIRPHRWQHVFFGGPVEDAQVEYYFAEVEGVAVDYKGHITIWMPEEIMVLDTIITMVSRNPQAAVVRDPRS